MGRWKYQRNFSHLIFWVFVVVEVCTRGGGCRNEMSADIINGRSLKDPGAIAGGGGVVMAPNHRNQKVLCTHSQHINNFR